MTKSDSEKDILIALGKKIREVRIFKHFTQMKLAALVNSEKSNISRLEAGSINPTFLTLKRIASILRVKIVDLIPANLTSEL